MLTLKQISEETERVIAGLEKKHFNGAKEAIDNALAIDKKRREAQQKMDNLLSEQKKAAGNIGKLMKEGKKEEAENAKKAVAALKEESKSMQDAMEAAEKELTALLCTIPNIPYDEVPEGASAEDNHVVKSNLKECTPNDTVGNWDANPVIESAKLPHWELAKKYNLIDFDLGVKISGAGFPVYIGMGARLQRALINFFLDEARASGYTEIMPPTVVNATSGYGTGQLPDKEGQMYHCEVDDLYLIPTAEVPVTNIYRDVIIDEKDLPIKNCAYTQCFRREAGSYGKDVRGLNRLHEFSKIELVRIDKPEHSKASHKEMLDHVEGLLKKRNCLTVSSFSVVVTRASLLLSATTSRFTLRLRSAGSRFLLLVISTLTRLTDSSAASATARPRRLNFATHSTVRLSLSLVSLLLSSKTSRLRKAYASLRLSFLIWVAT